MLEVNSSSVVDFTGLIGRLFNWPLSRLEKGVTLTVE